MRFHRIIFAIWMSFAALTVNADLLAVPKRETHIEGEWKLNSQLSDDAQQALSEQLKREHDRMMRMMREMDRRSPMGLPPLDAGRDLPPPSEDARARMRR